jgi:hypothetical protein
MAVPYNALPIETHVAMITAQEAQIPVILSAAEMWTEVRAWIAAAETELHTKTAQMMPHWPDDVGLTLERKIQTTLASLRMWGERIDASNVIPLLGTLAGAIPAVGATVASMSASYAAAMSNPYSAPSAIAFQQASGSAMTALGAQIDLVILATAAASGVGNPSDLIRGQDAVEAAADGATQAASGGDPMSQIGQIGSQVAQVASTVTQAGSSLISAVGAGDLLSGQNGLPGVLGGPALAGLAPTAPEMVANPVAPAGGGGTPGMPMGLGGLAGAASGSSVQQAASPVAGTKVAGAEGAPTLQSAVLSPSSAGTGGTGGMAPMMSPHGVGHGTSSAGTIRPGTGDKPAGRAGNAAPRTRAHGVPGELRGRSVQDDPTLRRTTVS